MKSIPEAEPTARPSVPKRASRTPRVAAARRIEPGQPRRAWSLLLRPSGASLERK